MIIARILALVFAIDFISNSQAGWNIDCVVSRGVAMVLIWFALALYRD